MMWLAFAAAVSSQAVIPMEFRGQWNSRLSACGTADWDPLNIDATSLAYDEYAGTAQRIVRHDRRTITVFATYSAEGHTGGVTSQRLVLSASGKELTIQDGRGATHYRRCTLKGLPKPNA